jgi:RNA polymerase sigma-70 factor (ECF subfamily)
MPPTDLETWFVEEVLPLEAMLMRFLRRNWRDQEQIADLRQEIYIRVYEAAAQRMPDAVKPFVFSVARNMLIDHARRARIVAIDQIADLEALDVWADELTPERHAAGRAELRMLMHALDELPPRCGEVVRLRKIDGLSQREVAEAMTITEDTVERQISKGMRALADALLSMGGETAMMYFKKKKKQQQDDVA